MKILKVIPSLDPCYGGPTSTALGYAGALTQRGAKVSIFTTDAGVNRRLPVPLGQPFIKNNFSITYFPLQYSRRFKISLPLAAALARAIPEYDIVHIYSLFQFSTLAAAHYCRKFNKPYCISTLGQMDEFSLRHNRFFKQFYLSVLENGNLNHAGALHFTTEEERRFFQHHALKDKGVVARCGVDEGQSEGVSQFGLFRKKHNIPEEEKIILFLGRLHFKKGLDILLSAFAKVSRDFPDAVLVIAGPDNDRYGATLRRLVHRSGLSHQVIFTGMLEGKEKLSALRDSNIFVLPSYSESFGISVIEAMSCGLPVVISDRVGIFHEVKQARAGVVVSCSTECLYQQLVALLYDERCCRDMGKNGKQLVREHFTWDHAAAELMQLYKQILENK
ncbi:MAG: glycosyltransferase [Candidatus Omnitrophica bacterium]|nr:glycosyltransferase [Candidatus Omnitrophota bacterium]